MLKSQQIRDYLTIRYHPFDKTQLKPITAKNFSNVNSDPYGYTTEELLEKTIVKSTPKTGNLVISLSGGIDSTLCLGLLRKIFPSRKITSICAIFEQGFDESILAKKVADKFETDFKIITIKSIFENIPEIISITKKPLWNTYQHFVAKEGRKFGKIHFSGDGADELFGGYTFRYNKFLHLNNPKSNWKTKTKHYLECHNRDWVPDQKSIFGSSIAFNWQHIYNYFEPFFNNSLNSLEQVLLADFNGKLLHDFIPASTAISKFYNIKKIPIFLDKDIRNHSLKIPINQKYNPDTKKGKLILRQITKRLGIEHFQEKHGFSPDLLIDWKNSGKEICESYLLKKDSYIYQNKLINFDWVQEAYEKVDNDGDIRYLNRLLSILSLEIWIRIFIKNEIKATAKL